MVEACGVCGVLLVPTPPILAYYTNFVLGYHSGRTAVGHVASLEFVELALMQFLVVAQHGAVGTTVMTHMGHGSCGITTLLSSGVRRYV